MKKNKTQPGWINKIEYPFASNYFETPYGKMHYVDEGKGAIILFIHGNPNWSFGYRKLIKHFSKTHRCIGLDHIGFGLSDKPYHVSYLPQFHLENLTLFINTLGLHDITLVVHDWGGPIGISYAQSNPQNVKRIIAYNSWFWSVKDVKTLRRFSNFLGSIFGRFLCKYFNFFPKVLLKGDVGDKKRFSKDIHTHYIMPFPTPKSRKGTWVFPKAIIGQSNWLNTLWVKRNLLAEIPVQLLWGLKDVAFTEAFLKPWQDTFINHRTNKYDYSGHNSPEEIGSEAIPVIEDFIAKFK